jgi:hypothetical protein
MAGGAKAVTLPIPGDAGRDPGASHLQGGAAARGTGPASSKACDTIVRGVDTDERS